MAPGTHSGGNRVNFSFDDSFPMMSSPDNDQPDAYGDDPTDRLVFETTYGEDNVDDDKDYHYYNQQSWLVPSRGRGRDYPGSPTPRVHVTQQRWCDPSRYNVHRCQQLRPDVNGGGGEGRGWEKLYSCQLQYVHDEDSMPKRTPGNNENHRRRLEEVVPNQAEDDTEQYIHRCPFTHCSHHHINVTKTDFVDVPQQSGQDEAKIGQLSQDIARTGFSSPVRDHPPQSHGNDFNIGSNTARVLREAIMHGDSSASVDWYHACNDARSSSLTPSSSSSAVTYSSWHTTTEAPMHQKSLHNYNNTICYQDNCATDCHLKDTTTLRQGLDKQEGTRTNQRLHPAAPSSKEGLPSNLMLEPKTCGAAARDRDSTCQPFRETFARGSYVHRHHKIGDRSNSSDTADGRYPSCASNNPGANEEPDLQGYVRREMIGLVSRAQQVHDGSLGSQTSSLHQNTYLAYDTEQEVNDIVKKKQWTRTMPCVEPSTVKQQVTPGLRRRAIEYIVHQLGGGIKRTSTTTKTTMGTNNSHHDGSLLDIPNSANTTQFTTMTPNRTTRVASSQGRSNTTTTTHSTIASSTGFFATQQEESHSLAPHRNTRPSTKAAFQDSNTTAPTSISHEDVSRAGCPIPGSTTEGDSPALRRLYRTVERLEETVYAAANAKKEDYMKILASKLAIIFNELKQHNSMQPPQPPSSLPFIASTPHTITPSVTAAPPLLLNTRHHSLPLGPRPTSGTKGVLVGEFPSRTKSLSEGDAIGQTRNSAGDNDIFTRPDSH